MARTYRCTVQGHNGAGALIMPSFHYQTDVPTGGDEPEPGDVADGLWSHIGATALAATPNTIEIDELVVTSEELPGDLGVAGSHTVSTVGSLPSGTGNELPDGVACVLDRHTATRSRSSRGWTMWPGPANSSYVSHNLFVSTYLANVQALAALLDDSYDLGTVFVTHVNPVVYSKTRRVRSETPYTFRVTSVTVNARPTWLRSRMTAP
jgi:hypothetical protein